MMTATIHLGIYENCNEKHIYRSPEYIDECMIMIQTDKQSSCKHKKQRHGKFIWIYNDDDDVDVDVDVKNNSNTIWLSSSSSSSSRDQNEKKMS